MARSCKIHNESRSLCHWIASHTHYRASHTHWRASSTHWRAIASRAPSNKQPQSFQTRCYRARVAGLVSTGTIDLVSGTNLYDSTAQDVIAGYQYRLCMTTHDSIGRKRYELSNHPKAFGIGNVLVAISDRKMQVDAGSDNVYDYFLPDVWVTNDYLPAVASAKAGYPFGMLQPGRNFSSEGYRFGFNGQERDNEISGTGNSYTAQFWQYDPRLGRRWNVDPVVKEWESPYASFANNPIFYVDPNGLDAGEPDKAIMVPKGAPKNPKRGEIYKSESGTFQFNGEVWSLYKKTFVCEAKRHKYVAVITKQAKHKEPTRWQNFVGWLANIDKGLRGDAYWKFGIEFKTNDGVMRGDPSDPNPVKPEHAKNVWIIYWDDVEDLAGAFGAITKNPTMNKSYREQAEDFIEGQNTSVGVDELKKVGKTKPKLSNDKQSAKDIYDNGSEVIEFNEKTGDRIIRYRNEGGGTWTIGVHKDGTLFTKDEWEIYNPD